ncbi:MAG: molybdopterin biosynthesis protein MoeB, partial [Alphaproteobacteria bacterium]|nr:molybdopterin biosynthesis protein MoeB [Alphaproteobacteria bacterium]
MSLPPARLDRFARHIVLPEIGGAGQVALARKHVVVTGLGGIGSPALQYLAASGIGRFTLVDDDMVDVSNLQRQTIFTMRDVGHGKATSARRWLANFDDSLKVEISDGRVTSGSAPAIVEGADLVLDGT